MRATWRVMFDFSFVFDCCRVVSPRRTLNSRRYASVQFLIERLVVQAAQLLGALLLLASGHQIPSCSFDRPCASRRQLVRCQPQRLARQVFLHAGDLEQHAAGLDDGDPVVRRALAAAHARLRRLRRHRLVREDADPDLAATLQLVRDRAAGRLDLAAVDPGGADRLQPEFAEADLVAAVRLAAAVAAVLLAELRVALVAALLVTRSPPAPRALRVAAGAGGIAGGGGPSPQRALRPLVPRVVPARGASAPA